MRQGDAFFAVFPYALDAVGAAVEAQRRLADAAWPEGVTVRVRMGLHSGEGRLGGDDYVGLDVHRAARVAGAGHGGQVLLSDATRVHSVSTEAQDLVLDAFEAALGATGPNPLHHRIEHAIEVSDGQLARMVAMDLVTIIHPDGSAVDWVLWNDYMGQGADYPPEQLGWLGRWRKFVDAGLHVAAATDAPWFFPDFALTDDIGRPVDQIAGGMVGRGREYPKTPEWVLDQRLTTEQGLRAVTLDAAYALGDETRRGHLAPGMLGDVTILSGDVSGATADEIRAMEVIATIVDGIVIYCSDTNVCAGG